MKEHWISLYIGIASALLQAVAYTLYNMQARSGASKPSATTWGITWIASVINAFSYRKIGGNIAAMQYFAGSTFAFFTLLHFVAAKKFTWPTKREWVVVALALCSIIVGKSLDSATWTNIIIRFAATLGTSVTIKGVWKDPHQETSKPWAIWVISSMLTTTNVIIAGKGLDAYVSPIVLIFASGSVAVLAREKRKRRFPKKTPAPSPPVMS